MSPIAIKYASKAAHNFLLCVPILYVSMLRVRRQVLSRLIGPIVLMG